MTHRLFIAIDAGDVVCAALKRAVDDVRRLADRVRWWRDHSAHITLAFLGECPEAGVPAVRAAVREVAGRHPPLQLSVRGAGTFGSAARPRVLWAGVHGDLSGLDALADDVQRALEPLGVEREARAFHPHLTLGRARDPRGDRGLAACRAALADTDFGRIEADAVVVYASHLGPSGARHDVVERCALDVRLAG